MSKLIDVIIEYNKLSQYEKELFKQVIGFPLKTTDNTSKKDLDSFIKKMGNPVDNVKRPFDPYHLLQTFSSLQNETN